MYILYVRYTYIYIYMLHVKKEGNEFEREQCKAYGRFWRGEGKGKMIGLYYNLKNKKKTL